MSKYEELKNTQKELKDMKKRISVLENAKSTVSNYETVNAIKKRADELEVYIKQFAKKYGMHVA